MLKFLLNVKVFYVMDKVLMQTGLVLWLYCLKNSILPATGNGQAELNAFLFQVDMSRKYSRNCYSRSVATWSLKIQTRVDDLGIYCSFNTISVILGKFGYR